MLVASPAPELALVHPWLDTWAGFGLMRLLNHFARTTKVRYDPLDQLRDAALPPRACSAASVGFMSWSKVGITSLAQSYCGRRWQHLSAACD
jgi:hypothetical protein